MCRSHRDCGLELGRRESLRAGGGGDDPPLRGADRRPRVRALYELRVDEAGCGRAFAVAEAILKLKQGFGRLIRTRRDRGIVVILDPRVRTKPYGRMFLASLPKCRQVVERV